MRKKSRTPVARSKKKTQRRVTGPKPVARAKQFNLLINNDELKTLRSLADREHRNCSDELRFLIAERAKALGVA